MLYKNIIYETQQGLARITINRPEVMNALNIATITEIKKAVLEADKDKNVGVIVLTGAGKAFSSGLDLKSLEEIKAKDPDNAEAQVNGVFRDAIIIMQNTSKAVIAMINGYCLTGALEVVMGCCDLIVASEEAMFGDTHARWGLRPTWGLSQRLPRIVGVMKAKELSFTAKIISAREAERLGLVNTIVPPDKLEQTVKSLAESIMANSLGSIAAYKRLYNQGMKGSLSEGLDLEASTQFEINDTQQRLRQFVEKS